MNHIQWQRVKTFILLAGVLVFFQGTAAACEIDFDIVEQPQSSQAIKNKPEVAENSEVIVDKTDQKKEKDQAKTDKKKDKEKTSIYNVGDVFTVQVTVTLTHRVCPTSIAKTKFKFKGLKVVGATKWKQLSTMVYIRKLKIEVIGTESGKLLVNAVRTCDKDGGYGSMTLQSIPLPVADK
jgi:hypothetical protein